MKSVNHLMIAAVMLLAACSKKEKESTDFKTDETLSTIEWTGSAPTHSHKGAFKLSGTLHTDGKGKVTGGDFSIPISSISNFDLTGEERNQLLTHLKTEDFFNVAVHPKANFHITKVAENTDPASSANMIITGAFQMIGETHTIQFPALIKAEGDKISTEGTFKLNRLDWGMNSYSDPQGELYILPEVAITLKIYSNRSGK